MQRVDYVCLLMGRKWFCSRRVKLLIQRHYSPLSISSRLYFRFRQSPLGVFYSFVTLISDVILLQSVMSTDFVLVLWFVGKKQMSAGAAVLTDSIYWTVIFPFLSLQDYEMGFVSFPPISLYLFKNWNCCYILAWNLLESMSTLSQLVYCKLCVFSDDCEFAY